MHTATYKLMSPQETMHTCTYTHTHPYARLLPPVLRVHQHMSLTLCMCVLIHTHTHTYARLLPLALQEYINKSLEKKKTMPTKQQDLARYTHIYTSTHTWHTQVRLLPPMLRGHPQITQKVRQSQQSKEPRPAKRLPGDTQDTVQLLCIQRQPQGPTRRVRVVLERVGIRGGKGFERYICVSTCGIPARRADRGSEEAPRRAY